MKYIYFNVKKKNFTREKTQGGINMFFFFFLTLLTLLSTLKNKLTFSVSSNFLSL